MDLSDLGSLPFSRLFTARLAKVLPQGVSFKVHHISTPPTRCVAIFNAPPGQKPERTYCESHFLTVSTQRNDQHPQGLLLYAMEILIYTTAHLTTVFVSKADSTGYLHLLELPSHTPSLLRLISTEFLSFLVEARQRPNVPLVVALFARAQAQYLFPGSVENSKKHVLDDKQLVKWWCRVLDPVLREYNAEESDEEAACGRQARGTTAKSYLIVPGFDQYETASFFPPTARSDPQNRKRWVNAHPLRQLSQHPSAPPRCLIPHFPDDPKSRFLDELDEEIPDAKAAHMTDSPSKGGSGKWKSVKTLEQFWEMMAFRQECSSGRLVGFIWVVFNPAEQDEAEEYLNAETPSSIHTPSQFSEAQVPDSPSRRPPKLMHDAMQGPVSSASKARKLSGRIIPRQPRIKKALGAKFNSMPEHTRYYSWPVTSRGQALLDEIEYKRLTEKLHRLDFADENTTQASTKKWIGEAAVAAGLKPSWGEIVVGERILPVETPVSQPAASPSATVTPMVRKKRKDAPEASESGRTDVGAGDANVLSAGFVRKKPKVGEPTADTTATALSESSPTVLSGSMIRKKPKAG
ncbi:H3 K56 histone acetylation protein KAT11 [Xylona heveae TC161]|uniref:histone acetyltransferase n=1 Tax=Xylona heveae (strain CBS 132557 / TC161) TaxID=1328760 RepID=A0A165AD02_XYLHT|nr:H3 K56 histone acetylation protein KAT11 [Xylona heveae TC161]KZF20274.1 H3 K56 histone acetylation protein KAT11 [Xylona heveae TC161]